MIEDQTLMQSPLMDTDEDELTVTLIDNRGNFKLIRGKSGPHTFALFSENRWK